MSPVQTLTMSIGNFEFLEEFFSVCCEFFMHFPGVFRCAEDELLDFVELVSSENSACVFAVCSCFFAEACADACKFERQVFLFEDFVHVHGCHRMLGCGDEVEIFVFDFVENICEVADGGYAFVWFTFHEVRWLNEGVAFVC